MGSAVTARVINGNLTAIPTDQDTSGTQKHSSLPIHSISGIKKTLDAMITFNHAPVMDRFTGTISVDVPSIMTNSAHTPGTHGAPGTIFIVPESELGKFTVYIVNQLGDATTTIIQNRPNGSWLNSKPKAVYHTFHELTAHLLSTIAGITGEPVPINFFTIEQRKLATDKLNSAPCGTYICFAHEPTEDFKESEESPPSKRNVIMWKTEERIERAYFHYDYKKGKFCNGGPLKPMAEEMGSTGSAESPAMSLEPLSDYTLYGLICKKIRTKDIEPISLP